MLKTIINVIIALVGLVIAIFGFLMIFSVIKGLFNHDDSYPITTEILGGILYGFFPVCLGATVLGLSILILKSEKISSLNAIFILLSTILIYGGLQIGGGLILAMVKGSQEATMMGIILFGIAPVVVGLLILKRVFNDLYEQSRERKEDQQQHKEQDNQEEHEKQIQHEKQLG